ncbi:ATP-binding protein [Hyphococcus sp. DH-69]|uniref:sensor histidine kinase n=1 Tax=Hyphococcus formosus TaxID=3143534 RepID=UPI00398ABC33
MLRLLRTTSFRFTIIYVVLFAGAMAALGAYLYSATFGEAAKQTDTVIDSEIGVLADLFSTSGSGMLTRVIRQRVAWSDDAIYMLIGAPSGAVLAGNLTALPPEALTAEGDFFNFKFEKPLVDAAGREVGVQQREARGKMMRFRSAPDAEQSYLVVVARDVAGREYLRERSQSVVMRAALVTIAFGVLIGLMFSRSFLRRVEVVNKTTRAIRGGDLSQRIPTTGSGDELDDLGKNLNSMLDQIERLMTGMRDVSDNIAHDLRSPLTRIRNRLNSALEGSAEDKDAALRATIDDSDKVLATFNALLSIARIRSGEGAGVMELIDIVAIAEEMAELYEPAAQDAGFDFSLVTAPTPAVKGSRELVSQAVANFLDNALKYAEGGSKIELRVEPSKDGGAVLSVADDGPGIKEEDRNRVLERFVRLEQSRTTPGSGLGLSLVSAIARAHGASLELIDGLPQKNGDSFGLRIVMKFGPPE